MSEPVLETTNLTKKYNSFVAVDRLNLEIQAGEVCLYLLDMLLGRYGRIEAVTKLVDRNAFYVIPVVNVDGSRVVRARELFVGAHRDIYHREVATLVAMAAGLLVGGPDGARPRPRDPLVNP